MSPNLLGIKNCILHGVNSVCFIATTSVATLGLATYYLHMCHRRRSGSHSSQKKASEPQITTKIHDPDNTRIRKHENSPLEKGSKVVEDPLLGVEIKDLCSPSSDLVCDQKLNNAPEFSNVTIISNNVENELPTKQNTKDFLTVHCVFSSQTGQAEKFSSQFTRYLSKNGINCSKFDAVEYDYKSLLKAEDRLLVFIVATTGVGEPPDNGRTLYTWITNLEGCCLQGLTYCVFGLGDRNYDKFNAFGKLIDKKLQSHGAIRFIQRVDSDASNSQDADFYAWRGEFLEEFSQRYNYTPNLQNISAPLEYVTMTANNPVNIFTGEPFKINSYNRQRKPYHAKNPFLAKITKKHNLYKPSLNGRVCLHLELDIENSAIRYNPGDHVAVVPSNDPKMVEWMGRLLNINLDTVVEVKSKEERFPPKILFPTPASIRTILTHYLDITSVLSVDVLLEMIPHAGTETGKRFLQELTNPKNRNFYEEHIIKEELNIIALLEEMPYLRPPIELLFEILPRLTCRYYSISSSQLESQNSLHITALVVDYITASGRKKVGVATGFLNRKKCNETIPIFLKKNPVFKLPPKTITPIIMIGPGTGIAPFRGFLQERHRLIKKSLCAKFGKSMLFFGCRSKEYEYMYEKELKRFVDQGTLDYLFVAFSRDQEEKIYVQNLLWDNSQLVWKLLTDGAYLYFCGDAVKIANDIQPEIFRIIVKEGKFTESEAASFIQSLKDRGMYLSDIW